MVDNRSAGFFGIGGGFNFKSGDISGTAANTQDDKMGPGTEYGAIPNKEDSEENNQGSFVDRSAQLRATLNSLAMMNVANVLNERKRAEVLEDFESAQNKKQSQKTLSEDKDEEFLDDLEDDSDEHSDGDSSEDDDNEF